MKVQIFDGYWTCYTTNKNQNYIFIFGDNDIQKGKKGQAVVRDSKNAFGIPTKKLPALSPNSFYTDVELEENKNKIMGAIEKIKEELKINKYEGIILPKDGLGTGLADLLNKAPLTFAYLNQQIDELIKYTLNI